MKKKLIVGLALACALAFPFAFAACGDSTTGGEGDVEQGGSDVEQGGSDVEQGGEHEGEGGGTSSAEEIWRKAVEDFCAESGVADSDVMTELQIFIARYQSFTLADGKYVAEEIPSVNGFVCKNVEIAMDGTKIVSVSYELRTAAKDVADVSIVIDKDGVHKTELAKPTDDKPMDEEEWNQQAAVFASVTNYSLERVSIATGRVNGAMKLDGTTYYEKAGSSEGIYEVVGGKYYHYYKVLLSPDWVKEEVDADEYADSVQAPALMVTVAAQAVQENFSSFTYEAGVYTAEELTVKYAGMEFTLRDMQITVSEGKIVRAVCTLVGGYWQNDDDERITVDELGTTTIVYPETFIDKTQAAQPGEVDEAAWQQAFTGIDNYSYTTKTSVLDYEKNPHETTMTVRFEGDKCEMIVSAEGLTMRAIVARENGKYVQYSLQQDGTWLKSTPEGPNEQTKLAQKVQSQAFPFFLFAERYDRFEYEAGKYTCASMSSWEDNADPGASTFKDIVVVFAGKSLESISMTIEAADGSLSEMNVGDIGMTKIELPQNYTEDPGEGPAPDEGVDEAAWQLAFADFDNYSYTTVQNNGGQKFSSYEIHAQGKNFELRIEGEGATHVIFAMEDGKYVSFGEIDGKWYKYVIADGEQGETQEYLAFLSLPLSLLADNYNEFTYEDGVYSCAELTLPAFTEKYNSALHNVNVSFEGETLVSITFDLDVGDEFQNFTVSDIGTTNVEPPKEWSEYDPGTPPDPSEVDGETWQSVLSGADNFSYNSSIQRTTDGVTTNTSVLGIMDGDKFEMTMTEIEGDDRTHTFIARENGRYVQYNEIEDGAWIRIDHDDFQQDLEISFCSQLEILQFFANKFDAFTYAEKSYTCPTLPYDGDFPYWQGITFEDITVSFAEESVDSISFAVRIKTYADIEQTKEMDILEKFVFTGFGMAKVELPKQYTDIPETPDNPPDPSETTAEIWASEIERAASNYTFVAPYQDTELRYTLRDGVNIESYTMKGDVKSLVLRDIKDTVGYTEYTYDVSKNEWTKRYFKATDDAVQVALDSFTDPLLGLKDRFNDFRHENGKYVCGEITLTVEGEETVFEAFEVVFEGNKIVSVTFERLGGVRFTYTNLGETEVKAPETFVTENAVEGYDPFGNPVGEKGYDAWDAAFKRANNFTLNVTSGDNSIAMKLDGDKAFMDESGRQSIVAKEGDVYSTYISEDNSTWKKESMDQDVWEYSITIYKSFLNALVGHYSEFTAQDGKFVCDSLEVTLLGAPYTYTNIEVVFENGRITSVKFHAESKTSLFPSGDYVFSDFGTTEIEIPTV